MRSSNGSNGSNGSIRSIRRPALLCAALVAAGSALAPPAFATEDQLHDGLDTQVVTPPFSETTPLVPRCFGVPATIVMTTPGAQLGTAGDDVIIGSGGDDFIDSLGGHDKICAGGGIDRITADYDPVAGTWDPLIIPVGEDADADDDYIDGQDDGDVVTPGAGNDHVWGSDGSDYLYGQLGDDTILAGDEQDWMHCDEGEDYADGGRGSNDWVNVDHGCETLISAAP
jgi:hypothetical protein